MKEKHPKEKLTRAHIRKDLRRETWKTAIWFVALIAAIVALVLCWIGQLRRGVWPWEDVDLYHRILYALTVPTLVIMGMALYNLIRGQRKELFITTGVLTSARYEENKHPRSIFSARGWCYMHFHNYGDFTASAEPMHRWSELYPLSPHGEYCHAFEGGEYYLVLSKPHSGKILMVYNKRLFELVE